MNKKKVIIVGAGISGLSAAVYSARAGFDTTILEQHFTFGGLSTAWSRKGYYFEGGMHWLTGSSEKLALNKVWKEIGALKENNPIEVRDPFYTVYDNGKELRMWRNADKLQEELLAFAPEDAKAIKTLCKDIKKFEAVHLPVNDIFGLKAKEPRHIGLAEGLKMLPAGIRNLKLSRTSYSEYVERFTNRTIKSMLYALNGNRYNASSFIYTMGSFSSGDCGYPLGGSVRMEQNIVDTFTELGGKIQYKTKVEKIVSENGKVTGVQTNNGFIPCDAVIVTQDTRQAVDTLFDKPIDEPWVNKLRKRLVGEQNVFIGMGVKADLSRFPHTIVFPLDNPIEHAGTKFTEIRIYNYAGYEGVAPEGCTPLTCLLLGPSYDYWKAAKADGTYKDKKDELGKLVVDTIAQFIPEVKEQLEVIDVATPLTYERYCSSFEGSWMSVWSPKTGQYNYPQKIKTVKGVYFAGQRIQMPGGLPICVYTGRTAVEHLCRDTGTLFV